MNHIILIGFMGAGKTSIGKELAKKVRLRFVDTDQMIEEETGRKISDIFEKDGEAYFRDLETQILLKLWKEKERLVIAVGGGLPERKINRRYLKELGTVVYLQASVDTLAGRLSGDRSRPKLQGGDLKEKIRNLKKKREDFYVDAATILYDTDGKGIREAAEELAQLTFFKEIR